ncbi:MAG: sigma-70 family RNA polymerase sigma factor [Verrucomicrobia bacterium]|nr:sigma-70 family RNA polymerase sigma factor [Verrucomicrobiota bacterium]
MPTEMADSIKQNAQQDESAVAAVRRGDAERYRELVERHERRVFAVAWSRLGDDALAEEVTQEAFIRAYRRLWLLGDGAKFAGWINTIARRIAINFGLRHRRELNKRERWALENPGISTEDNSTAEPDPLHTPETLRQTLAELPDAHRECLVLFYLEGKSGAEAAVALGVSEAALRVRLHRARAMLRERLEEKLEGSLAKLRPAKTLIPAIMASVLASASVKAATAGGTVAAGVGAKVLSVMGKIFLFSWFVPLLGLIGTLPSLVFVSFVGRLERRNFRDAGGFRPQLHRQFFRSFAWGFPLVVVLSVVLNSSTFAAWGIKGSQLFAVGLLLVLTLISARSLTIGRNPFQVGMFAYCVIIAVGISALALGLIPQSLAHLPILVATLLFFLIFKKRPTRMDYSLFLRAAQGLLKYPGGANDPARVNRFDRRGLLAFARFLGSRFLASNFRWETKGLVLRLPPVRSRFLTNMAGVFMPPISRNCSHISLGWDGTVIAHCGKTDFGDLSALTAGEKTDPRELESVVAEIVGQAWQEFRSGTPVMAERALGESPESEVFLVPPARAKATRWWRIFIGATVMLMMAGMVLQFWRPAWMEGLKPVVVTEVEVREFLGSIRTNQNPIINNRRRGSPNAPGTALFTCLVLPSTNLFSPEGLRAMRNEVAGGGGFDSLKQRNGQSQAIFNIPLLRRAVVDGWITWGDLEIQPEDSAVSLRTSRFPMFSPDTWDHLLTRCQAWSWVKSERFNVMRIKSDGVTQLRLLRTVNCLDLTDREKLIQQIASVQTLSGTPPGQPPIHDWRAVRGLFFTPNWPALQDTYFSLAALEILGGLDWIDREACIKGVLKRHRGKGYFTSPQSGGFNEYHIDGSARDTIAAFESLRILSALDRVKDLEKWRFRVKSNRSSKPAANGVRTLTWDEVEAWVCQQRLEIILRERKENPQAPIRSLLAP